MGAFREELILLELIGDCTLETQPALFNKTPNCGNFVVYSSFNTPSATLMLGTLKK